MTSRGVLSELVAVDGAPHGLNVGHAKQFNQALIRLFEPLAA
jgi:hypothetical protein